MSSAYSPSPSLTVVVSSTLSHHILVFFFFFQAEDGIRDKLVTGVQTCALPISNIDLAALPDKLTERRAEPLVAERLHANPTLDVIERAYITWVLQSEGGNKTRAAEVLGIDPSTLYRKLSRYEGDAPG